MYICYQLEPNFVAKPCLAIDSQSSAHLYHATLLQSLLTCLYIFQCLYPNPSPSLHYNDVIMGTIASEITSVSVIFLIVSTGTDQSSESLAFVDQWGLLGTGEFPAQMASNAGNVPIWWHHHGFLTTKYPQKGMFSYKTNRTRGQVVQRCIRPPQRTHDIMKRHYYV